MDDLPSSVNPLKQGYNYFSCYIYIYIYIYSLTFHVEFEWGWWDGYVSSSPANHGG